MFLEDPFKVFRPFLPTEETMPYIAWTPPCDIFETEKELVLKMELPDMKKEDLDPGGNTVPRIESAVRSISPG